MKRLAYLITLIVVLVSCGTRSGYFKLEGRLLNLNQGEFYVYSPDGVFDGVDTIKVAGGRFTYETPCRQNGTIMIVFPNMSEQPVFAEEGTSVSITGDASHLKEIEIEGTDENKLMNGFRKELIKASPPEVNGVAERFIREHPQSIVSVYILRKYFVMAANADVDKAATLAEMVHKEQPKNSEVAHILRYLGTMKRVKTGSSLPQFAAQDINGNSVSDAQLRGKVTVVYTFSSWNYESKGMGDMLKRLKNEYGNKLALVGISLDASSENCKNSLQNDTVQQISLCDQLMFDSPLLEKFALCSVPDNLVFNAQGRLTERSLSTNALETRLRTLLK